MFRWFGLWRLERMTNRHMKWRYKLAKEQVEMANKYGREPREEHLITLEEIPRLFPDLKLK